MRFTDEECIDICCDILKLLTRCDLSDPTTCDQIVGKAKEIIKIVEGEDEIEVAV